MAKTKGKGPRKAKNAKEADEVSASGSDTEQYLRDVINDNARTDTMDSEATGSGQNLDEDGDDGEDVGELDVEDDDVTETPEEEAARKKKEAADKKAAMAKKKAADKKAAEKRAEDARKAKKAAEEKKKEEEEKRDRDRRKEARSGRKSRSRSRSRSRPRGRRSRTRSRGRRSHRTRSKSPRRSRSKSMDSVALKTEVKRLTEKMRYMESKKRWNSLSNEKQYLHEVKVKQIVIEDVRRLLEEEYGSKEKVPEKLVDALRKGEKEIDYRIKLLKMADKGSWYAVEKYAADPLCDDEEDDKRWKAALKEAKEDMAKRKSSNFGYNNRNRGRDGYRSGYSGGRRDFRKDSRERRNDDRYVEDVGLELEGNCAGGQRLGPAIHVAKRATSPKTAGLREAGSREGRAADGGKEDFMCSNNVDNKCLEDKIVFDKSEERLDNLEGKLVEQDDEVCLMFEEDRELEGKVHNTLRLHLDFWKRSGASEFAVSVIMNGYVPQMQREPEKYRESNNKSYKEERAWANEAVGKLLRAKIIRETSSEELWCVNPLTVAKNAKGKRRLCIDLSRCVNKVIKAPKFKIQSTMAALQIIEKGDWMFSFDLKSAYLQVPINSNFVRWFGFSTDEDDGSRRFFYYKQMPFGLNDACRVLTKLLRSPLERWRGQGINVYLHVDDGLGIVQGKEAAVRASEHVRNDLKRYGLLMSEEKSEWGARREMIWTGFIWDTVKFKLFVPEDKLQRAESLVKELLVDVSKSVKVRRIAKVAGLLGSFTLAMGSVARFYSRGMLSQVAKLVNRGGWESSGVLEERVVGELRFWQENIRALNGWTMRVSEDVMYCREKCVNMFSDASDFQLAGARIEDGNVSWDTRFKVALAEEERSSSSTFRELRAIEEGLKAQGERLRGKTVRWGCDNWAAGKIVKWGSMKADCHEIAVRIEECCRKFQVRLETFWLSRNSKEIEYCDSWSKEIDTGDYWIEARDFRWIEQKYGPFSADFFASDRAWRMKPFFARFGVGESSGLDAFGVSWKSGVGYFHPPVGLIWKVVRKAEREKAEGVLIAPDWPGSVLTAVVESRVKEGRMVLREKWSPYMICPKEIGSDTFRGRLKFKMCIYEFRF